MNNVREWMVRDLRLALAGVPDYLPIRVLVATTPGDVEVQVLSEVGVVDESAFGQVLSGDPPRRLWLELVTTVST